MTEDIAELLRALKLKRMAELYDEEVSEAEKKGRTINQTMARLLRAEWHHQQERALEWRIGRAGMPEQWTLESFPFKKQPKLSNPTSTVWKLE